MYGATVASNLNYFGTFLDAWKTPESQPATTGTPNASPQATEAAVGFDGILTTLSRTGPATITEMVGHEALGSTGTSVDALLSRLTQMQQLHWVEINNGTVTLTDDGRAVAQKLAT